MRGSGHEQLPLCQGGGEGALVSVSVGEAAIRVAVVGDVGVNRSELFTGPHPPKPHCLVADVDPALEEQVLDIPQAQRKADLVRRYQLNDARQRVESPAGTV